MTTFGTFCFWALGLFLTLFAGRSTHQANGHLLMERPGHALLLAGVWVFIAYRYLKFTHE